MALNLEDYIASIKDFPTEGIMFRDVTPLIDDGEAFHEAIDRMAAFAESVGADLIAGPESRGFIFGCPVAYKLGLGFAPIRKPGKLPRETVSCKYDLEYGSNEVFMHKDAVKPGQRVVIVDDLLATGGTMEAIIHLVERLGGEVVKIVFVLELKGLDGMKKLAGYDCSSLVSYEGK